MVYRITDNMYLIIIVTIGGGLAGIILAGSLIDIENCKAMPGYDKNADLRSVESVECLKEAGLFAYVALPVSLVGMIAWHVVVKIGWVWVEDI